MVDPLDSPIHLRDPNPEPDPVHQPEDTTDGERTLTGDPTRNPDPSTMVPPPSTTSTLDLASALALLAQSMAKSNLASISAAPSSGSKVWEPDQFDGSDPKKLQSFLFQCQLNFRNRPAVFATNSAKVNHTVSFLRGTALDYFEPGLSAEHEPKWLSDFPTFWSKLKTYFSPYDVFGDVEAELEQLVMKDNHKAVRFFVEFNRIVSQLSNDYGKTPLLHHTYLALLKCLKDKMIHHPKPVSLDSFRQLVLHLDQQYWERWGEIACKPGTPAKSDTKPEKPKMSATPSTPNNNWRAQSMASSSATSRTPNPPVTPKQSLAKESNPAMPKKDDLTNKLGSDGKLMLQECQHHMDKGLCLLCGCKVGKILV